MRVIEKWEITYYSAIFRARKVNAMPKWETKEAIKTIYRKSSELGLTVDHVVPLKSDIVCGLHCWDNLQLLSRSLNVSKGNRYWPDMPDSLEKSMTEDEFCEAYFKSMVTRSLEASRLVLVEGMGIKASARKMGVDKASVSRSVKRLRI